ncbi:hypothetical protein [Sulfurospirillum oryzae]|uniref:hypothetical protein n=1 Tax=Sulfurospirillum oryzae TaxID=2976535 RepID=UPI0021E8209F|nr:hypothetical protein [Sulfurospirillum oryzae]
MFKSLHSEFEKKDTDLYKFQQRKGFSKYILIRSLDINTLKEIIKDQTGNDAKSSKQDELYKELFDTDITIDKLIEHILKKYPEEREYRLEQEKHLPAIIENFGDVKCGIRNDNMNDVAKALVRDKSILSKKELDRRVNELLQGTIKGYLLWQYYNQVTNDLIEHIVNDHPSVIPTIRKIHDVDFFLKINDEIVPFDLKITHISNDFFDKYTKGIELNIDNKCNITDDYCINDRSHGELEQIKNLYKVTKEKRLPKMTGQSKEDLKNNLTSLGIEEINQELSALEELKEIKTYYSQIKLKYDLPNMSKLSQQGMVDILLKYNQTETEKLLEQLIAKRRTCIKQLETDRKILEWWNYKNQGERLFKNNNRFFVFLAYRNSFEDARPLKGNVDSLKNLISRQLDAISNGQELNTINYYYDKDKNLKGSYTINATSVIYASEII